MLEWNKGKLNKVHLDDSAFGKGLFASEIIKNGDILLTVENDDIINVDSAFEVYFIKFNTC